MRHTFLTKHAPVLFVVVVAACLVLGAGPVQGREFKVVLKDGPTDHVNPAVPEELGLEVPEGGIVQWIVEITGDAQEIAFRDRLPDCVGIKPTAGAWADPDGTEEVGEYLPECYDSFDEWIQFDPPQPNAVNLSDGKDLWFDHLFIPKKGTLRIKFCTHFVAAPGTACYHRAGVIDSEGRAHWSEPVVQTPNTPFGTTGVLVMGDAPVPAVE